MDFSHKKLLVLGTSVGSVDIVKYAQSKGAYVIVTDYLPTEKSAAKQLADETSMVSTIDIEGVHQLALEKQVDGIFCGVSEPNLVTVQAVCKRMGLPCYFNEQQWERCEDKAVFKAMCREHGVPVADEYHLDLEFHPDDLAKIRYPVIVKPVDRSAAIGIHICHNERELREAYLDAYHLSFAKKVIVEEYLIGDEISAAYTVVDGVFKLSTIGDKYLNRSQVGLTPLPDAYVYPSKHLHTFMERYDQPCKAMLQNLGLKNGTVFLQGIVSEGKLAFFEAGLRMGGTALYRFISRINGVNILHMLVDFALTGTTGDFDINKEDASLAGNYCCILSLLNGGGTIGKIEGIAAAARSPYVADTIVRYNVGEHIEKSGTLKQSHIRFFLIAPSLDELQKEIVRIQSLVSVLDTNGKEMLLQAFDTHKLFT